MPLLPAVLAAGPAPSPGPFLSKVHPDKAGGQPQVKNVLFPSSRLWANRDLLREIMPEKFNFILQPGYTSLRSQIFLGQLISFIWASVSHL